MIQNKKLYPPAKIGIIGGGQLGKMISAEAKRMGYYVEVLDPTENSPASQVSDHQLVAGFDDKKAFEMLAKECDVITYEFEHIDAEILIELEKKGHKIYPSGKTLKVLQDKYEQKMMLKNADIPVPDFFKVDNESKNEVPDFFEYPFMLKTRCGGYDGKGNCVVSSKDEFVPAVESFKGHPLMGEKFVDFEKELSVVAARDLNGNRVFYPVVENIHKESILRFTKAPANVSQNIAEKAKEIAGRVLDALNDCGIFCIEMFLGRDGEVYVNEIAPRPHNSGHYTIEACICSQFEQLVRIITGMPLGSAEQVCPCAMANILGCDEVEGRYTVEGIEEILTEKAAYLHLYGKHSTKKLKKIGHLTVLDDNAEEAQKRAELMLEKIKIKAMSF